MSDKISDERVKEIILSGGFVKSGEAEAMAREIFKRRAADVKSVVIPSTTCIGWVKEAIHEHDEHWIMAIKAAGGTVKEGE